MAALGDSFENPTVQALIIAAVADVRSRWIDWIANPVDGDLATKIAGMLVETLDAHADVYLGVVDSRELTTAYSVALRSTGEVLIHNASETLKGAQKNEILDRVAIAFEGRYNHWMARAIRKVEQPVHITERVKPRTSKAATARTCCTAIADWRKIKIEFVSDLAVRIHIGEEVRNVDYAEFGFDDRRNGQPRRAWTILRGLAKAGGVLKDTPAGHKSWPTVEKRIQEIRRQLKNYFSIAADPMPFVSETGYRCEFEICLGRSYQK